jgi:hypothetical protein
MREAHRMRAEALRDAAIAVAAYFKRPRVQSARKASRGPLAGASA